MKLTIIREDGAVYKDGISYSNLDLSSIPNDVHALQFNSTSNTGWIEFTSPIPNEEITVLPSWAITAMTKWDEAEDARIAAEEAARLAAEAAKQAATNN
jgi:hypothetical protein